MKQLKYKSKQYDYSFPKSLIAQKPSYPRDTARLLVYWKKIGRVSYATFREIGEYLPLGSVLVFNETKVIPARLEVVKRTGGEVELLCIDVKGRMVQTLSNRRLETGATLRFGAGYSLTVKRTDGRFYYLLPSFPPTRLRQILERYGSAPLPYYIKQHDPRDSLLRKQYQAVFAKIPGSIAAPTASLHFTYPLIKKLRRSGYDVCFVTLHVGLGTFAPLTKENFATGKLHREHYEITDPTARILNEAHRNGRPIIAVGTTVVRALESAANSRGSIVRRSGGTQLFIRHGYRFRIVNGIVTNFHVPQSSLLMLVSAFSSRPTVLSLYRKAIHRRFRLFSFGDGMLLY